MLVVSASRNHDFHTCMHTYTRCFFSSTVKMAAVFLPVSILRQAAPRLSRRLFSCRICQNGAVRPPALEPKATFRRAFRSAARFREATYQTGIESSKSLLSALGKSSGAKNNSKTFPETSDKVVAYWLLGSAASVFGLVVFGGLTRLTESGYVRLIKLEASGLYEAA